LLIAAEAELAQLTVLHDDKDFELIAELTGQPVERPTAKTWGTPTPRKNLFTGCRRMRCGRRTRRVAVWSSSGGGCPDGGRSGRERPRPGGMLCRATWLTVMSRVIADSRVYSGRRRRPPRGRPEPW
jgi:hypothetical protein